MSSVWLPTPVMFESGMSSVWLQTQNESERYIFRVTAHREWMRVVWHVFDCTYSKYERGICICLPTHRECMRADCHLFDCTHRKYERGMSSVWLHTQNVWERFAISLSAHTECLRAVCLLFDWTHRMFVSVILSVWLDTKLFESVMSSLWLHVENLGDRDFISMAARAECMRKLCHLFDYAHRMY